MQKQVFESEIGESYIKALHPSGLKIYILEKIGRASCRERV